MPRPYRNGSIYGGDKTFLRRYRAEQRHFPGVVVRAGFLGLHPTNLAGVDLRGVDLCGANLYQARLHQAQLGNADLREADLSGAGPGTWTPPCQRAWPSW